MLHLGLVEILGDFQPAIIGAHPRDDKTLSNSCLGRWDLASGVERHRPSEQEISEIWEECTIRPSTDYGDFREA